MKKTNVSSRTLCRYCGGVYKKRRGPQRGGGYVESGSYGCVFRPPLRCRQGQEAAAADGTVSKLFYERKDARKEHDMNRFVESLDPQREFTVREVHRCEVDRTALVKEDLIQCHDMPEDGPVEQIIYEDGGRDIDRIGAGIPWKTLLRALVPVARGIARLVARGYVHQDIKPPNILYSPEKGARLIDFGLARRLEEVFVYQKNASSMSNDYGYYPPEFRLYMYIHQYIEGRLQSLRRVDLLMGWLRQWDMWDQITVQIPDGERAVRDLEAFIDYVAAQPLTTVNDMVSWFTREFAAGVDVFSFGATLAQMLSIYEADGWGIDRQWREAIYPIMCMDPQKRIKAADLATYVEKMIAELPDLRSPKKMNESHRRTTRRI